MTSKCLKLSNGSEIWTKNGKVHRDDGYAIFNAKTKKVSFYLNGECISLSKWHKYANISPKEKTLLLLKYSKMENNYE